MAVFSGIRRITGPLGTEARARLVGYKYQSGDSSSDGDDNLCLSELVHGFLEAEQDRPAYQPDSDSSEEGEEPSTRATAQEIARLVARCPGSDLYLKLLCSHVSTASEAFSGLRSNRRVFRRKVVSLLQELGHDAAICKTQWASSASGGGVTAGSHEFIDVVFHPQGCRSGGVASASQPSVSVRYFVDLDFASEFEIARATREYASVVETLPGVFVGKGEDLKRVVRLACDAARTSLKYGGLSLPPWRKNRYMQNKWFGPYTRTRSPPHTAQAAGAVSCRDAGFGEPVDGRIPIQSR